MKTLPYEDFCEVWWIYSPDRHAWGGLRIASFRKTVQGALVFIIHAETDASRIGLRIWDDVSEREGWVQVKQIDIPTDNEIAAAVDAKVREIAQDVMRQEPKGNA